MWSGFISRKPPSCGLRRPSCYSSRRLLAQPMQASMLLRYYQFCGRAAIGYESLDPNTKVIDAEWHPARYVYWQRTGSLQYCFVYSRLPGAVRRLPLTSLWDQAPRCGRFLRHIMGHAPMRRDAGDLAFAWVERRSHSPPPALRTSVVGHL